LLHTFADGDYEVRLGRIAVAEAGYVCHGMPNDEGLPGTYKVDVYCNGGSFTNSAGWRKNLPHFFKKWP
jgi:hypothetical protein